MAFFTSDVKLVTDNTVKLLRYGQLLLRGTPLFPYLMKPLLPKGFTAGLGVLLLNRCAHLLIKCSVKSFSFTKFRKRLSFKFSARF